MKVAGASFGVPAHETTRLDAFDIPAPAEPAYDVGGEEPPAVLPPFQGAEPEAGAPFGRDEIVSGSAPMPAPPSGPRRLSAPAGGGKGVKIAAVAAGAVLLVGIGAVAGFAMPGDSSKDADAAAVQPSIAAADNEKQPQADPKALEEQRRKQALERASRANRKDDGKAPALRPKGKPIPSKTPGKDDKDGTGPIGGDPVPAGEAQAMAKAMLPSFGFSGSGQFGCLVKLWNKESHWNYKASNPNSGAYGIPQALPGTKMASAGSDWRTNPRTQIKWGLGYIKNRYKTPCAAWSHSQSVGWY
ncbi:transglycosylase SLT domain-containing protein [Spirillospora sp. CA-294931]|uniref:aggregation-promoting factor C-terminal-like domain-containing protein n=1 Tax=Spirillospora sp. CA-294931 TaxID=3240042 RepID=UPI003D8CB1BC